MNWAKKENINESFEQLCANEKANKVVFDDLYNVWKDKKLNGIERISGLLLEPKPFTVEDKLMTPTMKLQRNNLEKYYLSKIEELYNTIQKKT